MLPGTTGSPHQITDKTIKITNISAKTTTNFITAPEKDNRTQPKESEWTKTEYPRYWSVCIRGRVVQIHTE